MSDAVSSTGEVTGAATTAEPEYDGGIGSYLRVVWAVARKDFILELRSKQALPLSVALSLLIVVAFAFSFGGARNAQGALWVAFIFAGTLGVMQSISVETQNSALDGMLLVPIPRSAIYLGKVLSSTVFVTVIGVITLGAISLFLHAAPAVETLPTLLLLIFLFSLGFSAVAVIVSIIATFTSISALLLPVLLVPLVVPALLAGVELMTTWQSSWVTVLLSYDGIMLTAGLLVFGELVQ
ncbi:MAG: heme exporter protein CcmB [Halodesulfurarchaeum sp.]